MSSARSLVALAAAGALSVGLAACTSADSDEADPTPSPSSSSPTASSEPEEIEVAVYGDRLRLRTYRQIADAFTAANPGVEVTLDKHPDAAQALTSTLNGLQFGVGPDVFLADQGDLPQLVESEGLEPVDRLLEARGLQFGDDHQRVALTSFSANSRLQCMPAEMSPKVVYLNTDLVPRQQLAADDVIVPSAVQPSWSWEDFETTARTVAGLDLLGPIKGVYIPSDIDTVTAFVRSADGEVVDDVFEPTSLTLASDDALEALGEIAGLARDPAVSLTSVDVASRDPLVWFTSGDLGMYVGTRDDLPALRAAEGLNFDVAPLPSMGRAQTVASVNGYCINAGTDHLDSAADFVAFAVGPEAAEIAARSGVMVPARLDTVHEEAFIQPGEQPRNSEFFGSVLRRAEPMPYDEEWPRVAALAEGVFGRLFNGSDDIELDEVLEERMVRLDELSESIFGEDG